MDGAPRELQLTETIAPDAWNAERAPRVAHPPWTVKAPVRRYAVPVDDASIVALGAVDVTCVAGGGGCVAEGGGHPARHVPARASVLFGDRIVWTGVIPAPHDGQDGGGGGGSGGAYRLTCGGVNLMRARSLARDVHILVVAPADADVRVTATVRGVKSGEGGRAAAEYETRGLFTMDDW